MHMQVATCLSKKAPHSPGGDGGASAACPRPVSRTSSSQPVDAPARSPHRHCMPNTALIWDDSLAEYRFTRTHPLNPRRLELTLELIRRLDLFDDTHTLVPAR